MQLGAHILDVELLRDFLADAADRYPGADAADGAARAAADGLTRLLEGRPGPGGEAPSEKRNRQVLAGAFEAAVRIFARVLAGPDAAFHDFELRYAAPGGIFETIDDLRDGGAFTDAALLAKSGDLQTAIAARAERSIG